MEQIINICIASTYNHYLKYVASFYESLCDNLNTNYQYHLFLFSNKEFNKDIKYKLFWEKISNLEITTIPVDDEQVFWWYTKLKNKNKVLLYRLVLSDYVNVDKCIFMDCDIIIRWDISKLYFTDLWDNIIWAAKDCLLWDNIILKDQNINRYFNAWVQLIDLKKRRENSLWKNALNFLNTNCDRLPFYDQDTLNILLKDKWLTVSPKYNWINISTFTNRWTQYTKEEFYDLKHPVIVHYAWDFNRPRWWLICVHPKRYLYYKYIFKTKFWDISDVYKFPLRLLTSNYLCRTLYKVARLLFHK